MSAIVGNLIRPATAVNDSLWRLVPNGTTSNVSLSSSSNYVSLPTSIVSVPPSPYSVQYTPANNCVHTIQKAGYYEVKFGGVFSNGSAAVANNYAGVALSYTQGGTNYIEQGTQILSPGSFGYACQASLTAYFVPGDTVTPQILQFSGNTMTFNMKTFSLRYSPC